MDNKSRSHGCVISHPYCSSLEKLSAFCLGQYSIPISNTTIRDLNGSPSLHKSFSNSNSSSAHTVCSDSFYLDDSLIKDFDQQTLVSQTEMVIQLFLNLGFLISWKRSELTPQNFLFLGEHYRTDLCLIFPPEEKCVSLCQRILLF